MLRNIACILSFIIIYRARCLWDVEMYKVNQNMYAYTGRIRWRTEARDTVIVAIDKWRA